MRQFSETAVVVVFVVVTTAAASEVVNINVKGDESRLAIKSAHLRW